MNQSSLVPTIITATPDETGWIHLVIAVSSSDEIYDGGLLKSIRFGTERAIIREHWTSVAMQLMVASIMLVHGIYACILYFIRPKKSSFCTLWWPCYSPPYPFWLVTIASFFNGYH
ncbi:hypothetical protein Q5O89_09705 [Peribacillus frigoritolerans]|nr:hypothetical protein [Peribacillus frigoritolerans]